MKKLNSISPKDAAKVVITAAALGAPGAASAQQGEVVLTPTNLVSAGVSAENVAGNNIRVAEILGSNGSVAGKAVYGRGSDSQYAVSALGLAGDKVHGIVTGGYGKEGNLKGHQITGKVAYTTDNGNNWGINASQTRVKGMEHPTRTWSEVASSTQTRVQEHVLPSETREENGYKNTYARTQFTPIKTIETTKHIHTEQSALVGSRTNTIGLEGTKRVNDNFSVYGGLSGTVRTYDNAPWGATPPVKREKHGTATFGGEYINDVITIKGEVSQNFGDNKKRGWSAGVGYRPNNNLTIGVGGGVNPHTGGKNFGIGFNYDFGGPKSSSDDVAYFQKPTASDYMNYDMGNIGISNYAPNNIQKQVKLVSLADLRKERSQRIENGASRIEEKLVDSEPIVIPPVITYETIEQLDKIRSFDNYIFDISYLTNNGWEVREVGEVTTQDGEIRTNGVDINTIKGTFSFFLDGSDVSGKDINTQTTYSVNVKYANKNLNAEKIVTYKYSFYGRRQ